MMLHASAFNESLFRPRIAIILCGVSRGRRISTKESGLNLMPAEITLSDEVRSLSMVPMLKQLDTIELEKLAELMEQISFKAGQTVFHKHDAGDARCFR